MKIGGSAQDGAGDAAHNAGDNFELPDGTIPPGVEQTSMHGDPGVEQSMPSMKIGGSAQNGAGDAAHNGGDNFELPDAKDNDIDGHLEGYEQADRIEKALQLEQFQLEEEEMAPEPSDGRKGKKKAMMPHNERKARRRG